MKKGDISIRKARKDDAEFIAQVVAMAIGDEVALHNYCGDNYISVLTDIACTEDTQYSWHNAIIAECDGKVAGAVVGYDGALLEELRNGTFAVVLNRIGRTPDIANETEAGEYYLDSIGVLPKFRKIGIATKLIEAMRDKIFAEGHTKFGLIVDFDNPTAERLYTQIGFKRVGQRTFLGHKMWHLVNEK
jgi:ribosomal protein S18 acetylase RimI-like enzyme